MPTFLQLIPRLREAGVKFVIIGGVAAVAHGALRNTMDLDIAAPMALDNLQKLITAIQDLRPKFRMRPDLPVVTPDGQPQSDGGQKPVPEHRHRPARHPGRG